MAAAPAVMSAFQLGSGVSGPIAYDVMATLLAGLALIWLAWAVSGIGNKVLAGQLSRHQALWYVVRATVMVLMVVFYLVR